MWYAFLSGLLIGSSNALFFQAGKVASSTVKRHPANTVFAISEYRLPRDVFIRHLDDTGAVIANRIAPKATPHKPNHQT